MTKSDKVNPPDNRAGTPAMDAGEFSRQAAILSRFRELLACQGERFHSYLTVLDKQRRVIESGSAEDLIAHVELEEQIAAGIFSLQKVIDPLELMYWGGTFSSDDGIPTMKAVLKGLKNRAAEQSKQNRELLSGRMAKVRAEITALRNNPFAASMRRSAYHDSGRASLIDIKG